MSEDFLEFEIRPKMDTGISETINKSMKGITKNFKGATKKIGSSLNSINGNLKTTFSGKNFEKGITGVNNFNSAFMSIIATAGLVTGAIKGMNISSNFIEETGKLEFAFGKSSDTIKQFIDDMDSELGIGVTSMTSFVAQVGAKIKGLGVAEEDMASFTKTITKMSLDMAEAFHGDPGEMTEIISAALTGQTKALKKFGIVIDETALKQESLSKGIDFENLNEADKATIMLNKLNEQLEKTGIKGFRTNMVGSYETALESVQERLKDITAISFAPLTQSLAEPLQNFSNFLKDNKKTFESFGQGVAKSFDFILGSLTRLQEPIAKLGSSLSNVFGNMDLSIFETAFNFIVDSLGYVIEKISEVIDYMKNNSEGFSILFNIMGEALMSLKPLLSGFFDFAIAGFKLLFKIINSLLEFVAPVLETIGAAIKKGADIGGVIFEKVASVTENVFDSGDSIKNIANSENSTKNITNLGDSTKNITNLGDSIKNINNVSNITNSSTSSISEVRSVEAPKMDSQYSNINQNEFNIPINIASPELQDKLKTTIEQVVDEHLRSQEVQLGVI